MTKEEYILQSGLNLNSNGGTEQLFRRLVQEFPIETLEQFQIIPSRLNVPLDHSKLKILWCHDVAGDPIYDHLKNGGWKKFDKIVFVSYWQMNGFMQYYGIMPSRCHVIQNLFDPIPEKEIVKSKDKVNFFYHPVPRKGLPILAKVFDQLTKDGISNIHLDIYSSFSLYGAPQGDEQYKEIFDICKANPQITVHEVVSNEEVKKALAKANFFAYPSIFPETSCLSLIEAMSAQCLCITPTLAALPETGNYWTYKYPFHEDLNVHANIFYQYVRKALEFIDDETVNENLRLQKHFTDKFHSWEGNKFQWEMLFNLMIQQGKISDKESSEMFVYGRQL